MDPAFRCHGMKVITLLGTNGPSMDSFLLVFAGYGPRGSGVLTYWDSAGMFPTKVISGCQDIDSERIACIQ